MNIIKEKINEYSNNGLTDKSTYHSYDTIYPRIMEKFLGKNNNILEIGTGNGGGLMILSESFPESTVYGLDHNYSILKIETVGTNIKLLKETDQNDENFINEIPMLDLVVEDASHDYNKSIKTFEMVIGKLNPGAIYIIEDVYPQYIENYNNDGRFEVHDLRKNKDRGDDIIAVYKHK